MSCQEEGGRGLEASCPEKGLQWGAVCTSQVILLAVEAALYSEAGVWDSLYWTYELVGFQKYSVCRDTIRGLLYCNTYSHGGMTD